MNNNAGGKLTPPSNFFEKKAEKTRFSSFFVSLSNWVLKPRSSSPIYGTIEN